MKLVLISIKLARSVKGDKILKNFSIFLFNTHVKIKKMNDNQKNQ